MGRIRVHGQGDVPLHTHHLVGRSRAMHSRLSKPDVSAQHLSIEWSGGGWLVRDLASRNGTLLDGVRLAPGESTALSVGAVLEVGSPEVRVTLIDDAPPTIIAECGGVQVVGDAELLALPSADNSQAVVLFDADEGWVVSTDAGEHTLQDGDTVEVLGERWVLTLPEPLAATVDARQAGRPSGLSLEFTVSADDEYVEVSASSGAQQVSLPPRAHHYVLLTLARLRLADADLSEGERGWVYRDQLQKEVGMSKNQLYVSIHRLRKELEATDLFAGCVLIEQRKTTRQLRLGTDAVRISSF